MKKTLATCMMLSIVAFNSCSHKTLPPIPTPQPQLYLELYSPEEGGLNLVKITDEAAGNVIAGRTGSLQSSTNYTMKMLGFNVKSNFQWNCSKNLAISPDGTKLAYLAENNKQRNIIVRNTTSQGVSTQRTFRNVAGGFCWGTDDRIYFGDNNNPNYYISSVNALQGSVMSQHTNGNVDDSYPALSSDGDIIFFTRWQAAYGPSIWALNKKNGTLSSCARGFMPCLIPGNNDAFYCVRNSTSGRSEIWYIDYVHGQESIVLSDENRSYTSPCLSPDGKWLLLVGNSMSSISKKQNTDIFVVRTDGSQCTQLTYHPADDQCPVWSADGKNIFFISSRATKDLSFNIWRMNFQL